MKKSDHRHGGLAAAIDDLSFACKGGNPASMKTKKRPEEGPCSNVVASPGLFLRAIICNKIYYEYQLTSSNMFINPHLRFKSTDAFCSPTYYIKNMCWIQTNITYKCYVHKGINGSHTDI